MPFPSNNELRWKRFLELIRRMPKDEIQRHNEESHAEAEKLHAEFSDAFTKGMCDSCGKPLTTFSDKTPCFHWLLRPKGVKKQHIELLLQTKGYIRSATYLRWVANQEARFSRINDLKDENSSAVIHWSAAYKHIKWTFICSESDLQGHAGTISTSPHFHFEMRLDGKVFIKFNDFHISFTDEDTFYLRCNRDENSVIKQSFGLYGAGMEVALSPPAETLLDQMTTPDDPAKAVYRIQTIIQDPKAISTEKIQEAFDQAKRTGKPVAAHLIELGLTPTVLISPSGNEPEKGERNNPRGR